MKLLSFYIVLATMTVLDSASAATCAGLNKANPNFGASSISCNEGARTAEISSPNIKYRGKVYNVLGAYLGNNLTTNELNDLCRQYGFDSWVRGDYKFIFSYFENAVLYRSGRIEVLRQAGNTPPLAKMVCKYSTVGDSDKNLDDMIRNESVSIDTRYNGLPLLAVTGYENYAGWAQAKKIERANALCSRFGYGKPVSVTVSWTDRNSFRVITLDEQGNFLDQFIDTYYGSYTAYFETLRCAKNK